MRLRRTFSASKYLKKNKNLSFEFISKYFYMFIQLNTTTSQICIKFVNYLDYFICIQISLGDRYKSSSYDMEQDPTTHKSICRWARGAACSPPPTTPQSSSLATQVAQCAKGSECVSTTDGTTCTGTTVSKFLTASIMRQETFDTFMDGMLMGKTCVCSDGKKSAKRTKRSSLEIHEEDARRISALL